MNRGPKLPLWRDLVCHRSLGPASCPGVKPAAYRRLPAAEVHVSWTGAVGMVAEGQLPPPASTRLIACAGTGKRRP